MIHTFRTVFAVLLLALELAGCTASFQAVQQRPILSLFYATDRARSGSSEPGEFYNSDHAPLQYGTCTVSVPQKHQIAELETPVLRMHPERHFELLSIDTLDQQVFFDKLGLFMQRDGSRKTALVFVHGFNISFEAAALRMAQMTSDLDFRGTPLVYSWPSDASLGSYREDERSVVETEGHLYHFLCGIAERSGKAGIYLLAHSMGTRALTSAFIMLAKERPELLSCFGAIVLAAPDINAERFRRELAPSLAGHGVPVTVYASRSDNALRVSENVNGNPRAGEVADIPLIVPGIETIDATDVDSDLLGHSYYNRSRTVLSDMFYIISRGLPASERFSLQPVDTAEGRYWRFRK